MNSRFVRNSYHNSLVYQGLKVLGRAVESEVPSSDSDSGQFQLSGSDLQLY